MGELRIARVAGGDEVSPEFFRLSRRFREATGFLIARPLADDTLPIPRAADVVMLAFGDVRTERFDAILTRARARNP